MVSDTAQSLIDAGLSAAGLAPALVTSVQAVGGGNTTSAWRVTTPDRQVFVKTMASPSGPSLWSEATGLAELARSGCVRVPAVLAKAQTSEGATLVLEWLALSRPGRSCAARFGRQLARLHRCTAVAYGFHADNWLGRSRQQNEWCADWTEFFCERRLQAQLQTTARRWQDRELVELGCEVWSAVPGLLAGYTPSPSLLHGDLWGGNWGACGSEPVTFDPAVYFGDRETDLAMTHLFGGFDPAFYAAYEEEWPLDVGHRERRALYQLYHVLNHYNLYGTGYRAQALQLMRSVLERDQ
ncbi:MAG: fructosamine kinase family protein [Pseudomonadota bacterium]